MKKYSMTCTCRHVMTVDANSKEEATVKMKQMMDQKGLDDHWTANHAGQPMDQKPTLVQSHAVIDQMLAEVMVAAA